MAKSEIKGKKESGAMVIKLTATPTSGTAPLEVEFQAGVQGGTPPYIVWKYLFGNGDGREDENAEGSGSSSSKIKYTYPRRGNFPATVTVRDSAFNEDSSSPLAINVTALPLTAQLRAEPTSDPAPPRTWTFWVTYGGGIPGYIVTWNFGDTKTPLIGPLQDNFTAEMRYTYNSPGNYTVTATVTDGELDTKTASIQIDVANK